MAASDAPLIVSIPLPNLLMRFTPPPPHSRFLSQKAECHTKKSDFAVAQLGLPEVGLLPALEDGFFLKSVPEKQATLEGMYNAYCVRVHV